MFYGNEYIGVEFGIEKRSRDVQYWPELIFDER